MKRDTRRVQEIFNSEINTNQVEKYYKKRERKKLKGAKTTNHQEIHPTPTHHQAPTTTSRAKSTTQRGRDERTLTALGNSDKTGNPAPLTPINTVASTTKNHLPSIFQAKNHLPSTKK